MKGGTLKINFAINVFGAVIPLVVALVTVPVYVRHIGDARYGVLSIVWVLLGYFGFLDLGLSRAAANALARLRQAPQGARAHVLVTTLVLNLGLGLFGSFCLAVFGSYLLQHVLTVPEALKPEVAQAFPWIVGLFPLALVSGVGIGALESRERFLLANLLQVSGYSLGQIAPVILAVVVSPSLAVVIPAAATARALSVVAILIAVYRDEGPLSLAAFDRHQVRKLLSYGGWITVTGIISPILSSLDQFMIGSLLNVAAVAHYAVPMNLVTRSQVFAGALTRTLFPRMSSVGPDEAHSLASRAVLALAYIYGSICAPAIILTPVFFKYWIGADFAAVAAPVAEILFFGAWINGIAFVPSGLLQSQGRPDIPGKFHAAELLPFIVVLWGLTSALGITGAALAWNLRCAGDAACLLWATRIPGRVLLKAIGLPLCLLAGSYFAAIYIGPNLWVSLAAGALAGLAGVALGIVVSKDLRDSISALALWVPRSLILAGPGAPPDRKVKDLETTTISVAMATYNGARFIREQLDSLAAQTVLPMELMVTDDGSTDDTLAIIEEFAKTAAFQVRIVRNETRLGYRANFMKCATMCTGDLIAFCDQDDVWFRQKLERQLSHFADPRVFLSGHNVKLINQQGRDLGRNLQQFRSSVPFSYWSANPFAYCQGFTQVFRRQLLSFFWLWDSSIDHNIITERMAHDQWYFFLALVIGFVKYDLEPLALYRQHDSNASGSELETKNAVSKILHKFDWRPQYEPLRTAAANREQILKTLSSNIRNHLEISSNAKVEDHVKNACLMYARLHESLERRHSLYSTTSIYKRMRTLISSVNNGDYKIQKKAGNIVYSASCATAFILLHVKIEARRPDDVRTDRDGSLWYGMAVQDGKTL